MSKREQAIQYLKVIIEPLCRFPDELVIEDKLDLRGLIIDVRANKEDTPLLVGRGGIIKHSISNIMNVWGAINLAKIVVYFGSAETDFEQMRNEMKKRYEEYIGNKV